MRAGQGSRETHRQERLLQQHSLVISSDRTAAPYGRHIQLGSMLCLLLMAPQPLQLQAQPSGSLLALNCSKEQHTGSICCQGWALQSSYRSPQEGK